MVTVGRGQRKDGTCWWAVAHEAEGDEWGCEDQPLGPENPEVLTSGLWSALPHILLLQAGLDKRRPGCSQRLLFFTLLC